MVHLTNSSREAAKGPVWALAVLALVWGGISMPRASSAQDSPAGHAATDGDRSVSEPYGVTLRLGPSSTLRRMELLADAETIRHEPFPSYGGRVDTEIDLVRFDSPAITLGLSGEFEYGVADSKNVSSEDFQPLVTQMVDGGGSFEVIRDLTPSLTLAVGLGANATSVVIEANPTYTGHRYISGVFSVGLDWWQEGLPVAAGVEVAALPVLALNQSSGGYGDGEAFGARAEGEVGLNVFERESGERYAGGRVLLHYRYERFRAQFPSRRISLGGGVSVDQLHTLSLMFAYHL